MFPSSFLKPIPKTTDFARFERYIAEIDSSFSGRMDTDNYNTFLLESAAMLSYSLRVFCEGYFDAAFYMIRSAIEVSTVGVYFSDSQNKIKDDHKASWKNLDYFPVQKKILSRLKDEGAAFSEFRDKMPAFFDLLKRQEKNANKVIHKQGYSFFYCVRNHPAYRKEYDADQLLHQFTEYMRDAIGIVAIMRLAIDPFPVILMDTECENRFTDSLTEPFSESLINECIGEEIILQYKETELYTSYKQWLIKTFPKMNDATCFAQRYDYIYTDKEMDLLGDIHLVSFHCACAILFTLIFKETRSIYTFGGMVHYLNSKYSSLSPISSTASFEQVTKNNIDNYKYEPIGICTNGETGQCEHVAFLSSRQIGDEKFVFETKSPLSRNQLKTIDEIAEDLNAFYSKLSTSNSLASDIKFTQTYKRALDSTNSRK